MVNLPPVSMTLAENFATGTAGVVDTDGKFATGVNDSGGKFTAGIVDASGDLLPLSLTLAASFPPVLLTPICRYQRHQQYRWQS
jgi:hypothetical protein